MHFLGHRPSGIGSVADAVRLVSGCDLLVAPSRREPPYGWQEGFGLAVAEAMRVGTPVVAYRNGSLPEVLGDCGELVDEGDTAGLAAAITAVLGDSAAARAHGELRASGPRPSFAATTRSPPCARSTRHRGGPGARAVIR